MDNHASSSRSHPKTLTDATSTGKGYSPSSAEQALNTWVEDNAQMILKAMATLKRAKLGICMCPRTVARYSSTDGTEEDLRSTLVSESAQREEETALTTSQEPHLQGFWPHTLEV